MIFKKLSAFSLVKNFLISSIVLSFFYSAFLFYQQKQSKQNAVVQPPLPFKDLLILDEGGTLPEEQLLKYLGYFETVARKVVSQPDTHAMIGFCYYHLGKKEKAITAYQKAVSFNANFLWFQYNLGIIYFEQGQYKEAVHSFKKILERSPEDQAHFLRNCPLFSYILYKSGTLNPPLPERLKRGYGLSSYFAALCLDKLGKPAQALPLRLQAMKLGVDAQKPIKPQVYLF